MNKFKVGQKVYSSKSRYRNLEVKDFFSSDVLCKGESYHKGEKNYTDGWHPCEQFFRVWEIRDTPFKDNKPLHTKSKWDKIIQRSPNMRTTVAYVYEDVLSGKLDIAPVYQRGLVWTLEQKQSYILNLFNEKATISPTLILNWEDDGFELLDGKQRITTVFEFIEDRFELPNGLRCSDLCSSDFYFILYHPIHYTRIEKINQTDLTLEQKIELFLEINELGTKMSEEHIEKVKEMIS